jgi:hypothetical protein
MAGLRCGIKNTERCSKSEVQALSEMMNSYWVNLAKNGNPNGPGLPTGSVFEEKEQQTRFFDKIPGARQHPNLDQLNAFDAYYAKLREKAKAGKQHLVPRSVVLLMRRNRFFVFSRR